MGCMLSSQEAVDRSNEKSPRQTSNNTMSSVSTSPGPDSTFEPQIQVRTLDNNHDEMSQIPETENSVNARNLSALPNTIHEEPTANPGNEDPAGILIATPTPLRTCLICSIEKPQDESIVFPCRTCSHAWCVACVRKSFLSACDDESMMPPKCCKQLQLSVVMPHLSKEEVELFKAKFEEWNTPNRVYCPVPSCSAFIPNRLLPTPPPSLKFAKAEVSEQAFGFPARTSPTEATSQVTFGTGVKMEVHEATRMQPSPSASSVSSSTSTVSCPKCDISICTSCKQIHHPGSPCTSDLDPGLEDLLTKWKIKRCPKCRTAVKRMFGCSHMRCRCGAQWCWYCLNGIQDCQGQCDGYDSEEDEDEEYGEEEVVAADREEMAVETPRADPEDLDAGRRWANTNLDFGGEPNEYDINPWNCNHKFTRVCQRGVKGDEELECHHCWRTVFPETDAATAVVQDVKMEGGEDTAGESSPEPANVKPSESSGTGTDVPFVGHFNDEDDRDDTFKKGKAPMQASVGGYVDGESSAWECTCGMMVCTKCKIDKDRPDP
ncbi:MAG: hypothetical protein M1827_001612 [Pycnora praestabilis]|nr:MAG: hypothetical protein M1827_001612 [Pycnora praestabilis]